MEQFLSKTNTDLTADEIHQIMDSVRLVGAESDFATLHKVYGWMVSGIQFTPQNGIPRIISLIDFETPDNNIFRCVNQFAVEYINNGQKETRRPDVLLFVNGLPLCVIELKNPADGSEMCIRDRSRLIFVIGVIFLICSTIALWHVFRTA